MWILRSLAIISFLLSIVWTIAALGFEPIIASITSLGTLLSSFLLPSTASTSNVGTSLPLKKIIKPIAIGLIISVNVSIVAFVAPILFRIGANIAEDIYAPPAILPSPTPGPTWEQVFRTPGITSELETAPGGVVFFGASDGIFKSENNGTSWELANNGFIVNKIYHFAISVDNPRHVLVSSEEGVWQTSDGGQRWREVQLNLWSSKHWGIAIIENGSLVVPGSIYRQRTFTNGFEKTEAVTNCSYMESAYYDNRVYCSTLDSLHWSYSTDRLLRSDDGGVSWTGLALNGDDGIYHIDVSHFDSDTLYLARGLDGILRSLNGGYNWQNITADLPTGGSVVGIVSDPQNPRIAYAAITRSNGGIYRYIESQNSWEYLGGPDDAISIAISFDDPNLILVNTERDGIWRLSLPKN